MNRVKQHWSELEDDEKVTVRIEEEDYDALMCAELNSTVVYFEGDKENDTVFSNSSTDHDAPFNFEVLISDDAEITSVEDLVMDVSQGLSEKFNQRCKDVFMEMDSVDEILELGEETAVSEIEG